MYWKKQYAIVVMYVYSGRHHRSVPATVYPRSVVKFLVRDPLSKNGHDCLAMRREKKVLPIKKIF